MNNVKAAKQYEKFLDESSFHMWIVRPITDRTYGAPGQKWFMYKKDAEIYLELMNAS